MTHRFKIGEIVKSASGKHYRIEKLRDDDHHKLKGEIGYEVQGLRDGKDFGPRRLIRDSSLAT